jgi:uridine kinase
MPGMDDILDAVDRIHRLSGRVIVGISGFGGSGKSTLARSLNTAIPGSARIRGDDFLDPDLSHERSTDWDGVDRLRLRREVLDPFRDGRPGTFRRFDWGGRRLGPAEPIPDVDVLLIDAIGLFHPELDGALDLTVWVDLDLAVATERGKTRDRELGRDHDHLWDGVWVPNERDFVARFNPRERSDLLFHSG